jgi:hypothetical protein
LVVACCGVDDDYRFVVAGYGYWGVCFVGHGVS